MSKCTWCTRETQDTCPECKGTGVTQPKTETRYCDICGKEETVHKQDKSKTEDWLDEVILDIVYEAGQIERGRTVTADWFAEAKATIRSHTLDKQEVERAFDAAVINIMSSKGYKRQVDGGWLMESKSGSNWVDHQTARHKLMALYDFDFCQALNLTKGQE